MLQKQRSKQQSAPANNFFVRVHKIDQSKNFKRCTVAMILNRLYFGVCSQMGTACACEVYETSSNLSFACFSRKSEIFNRLQPAPLVKKQLLVPSSRLRPTLGLLYKRFSSRLHLFCAERIDTDESNIQ